MGTVLGALAELGYGFAYRVLDAQYFGVPQQRRRVVIVGCAGADGASAAEVLLEPDGRGGDLAPRRRARQGVAALTANGVGGGGGADDNSAQAGHLIAVPIALRGRESGSAIEAGEPGDPAFALRTPAGGSSYPMVAMAFNPKSGGDVRIGYRPTQTALTASVETAVQVQAGVRRLMPIECERLQGFPDGWTATSNGKPQADAPRYREIGNALAIPVFTWVAARIVAVDARLRAERAVSEAGTR